MNRHKRRAAKHAPLPVTPAPTGAPARFAAPADVYSGRPGLVLRFFAKVLLSKWVLKRVSHPDVRRALASLAAQAGRAELSETLRRPQ